MNLIFSSSAHGDILSYHRDAERYPLPFEVFVPQLTWETMIDLCTAVLPYYQMCFRPGRLMSMCGPYK